MFFNTQKAAKNPRDREENLSFIGKNNSCWKQSAQYAETKT